MSKGQVLPDSHFGRMLTATATQADVIVEIGTWHGGGSTLCLQMGMTRPEQRMWSVEQDAACYQEAVALWAAEPRITFIHGEALQVLGQLPKCIDLLLLDGSDDTSYTEFMILSPRSRFIALDDTQERKNRRSWETAHEARWRVVADEPNDRHGWAIFERGGQQP